jgi:hypothetical protein
MMAAAHAELVSSKVIVRRLMIEPDPYVRGLVASGVVRGPKSGKRVLFVLSPGLGLDDIAVAADAELRDVQAKLTIVISRAHEIERDRRLVMPSSPQT